MRRVRYYLGGALFWGAFLAVCVLLFWNAQRLARAAGGISLRYGEALEPRVVASALEYARDGRNNAAWSPTFWAVCVFPAFPAGSNGPISSFWLML